MKYDKIEDAYFGSREKLVFGQSMEGCKDTTVSPSRDCPPDEGRLEKN